MREGNALGKIGTFKGVSVYRQTKQNYLNNCLFDNDTCVYWIEDEDEDDGYLVKNNYVIGKFNGTYVDEYVYAFRYINESVCDKYRVLQRKRIYEQLHGNYGIYNTYKTIENGIQRVVDCIVESKPQPVEQSGVYEKINVDEIIFSDYSGVVDKFFEDMKKGS